MRLTQNLRLKGSDVAVEVLLNVRDLKTYFYSDSKVARAVDGVSFQVGKGRTLGLVGESGCGKSVTALSILRLVPSPPGKIVEGEIIFEGRDLLKIAESEMRSVRGNDIAMVFQEPMTSLNPVFTIGYQIAEAIRLHQRVSRSDAREQTVDLLRKVGIPSPDQRYNEYPHQLSGGMKQRAMIAMGISCHPKLLIADEPTTALDVTIQAQILDLLAELRDEFKMSTLLITHDLGVIAEMTDDVAVMYAGQIMEYATTRTLFANPKHPYTIGLFGSLPKMGEKREHLEAIEGFVPDPAHYPAGCRFHPRCNLMEEKCRQAPIELREIEPDHFVRCWKV
ncbi:MAG: ABC transporter ATP-binding protein [Candidatus Abyssobacteria bacterium SURF_17]|uniref:ABC transporter ATP-binding protein n=1 Tax=Candidatus Abyssobacteria bacterium SURF_17 TaxID=2093361 RepID=A0A419F4M2_9BACT|nr:MAG: ABC transporter ATP-binding protein [Candidatus Abyssubacteria bacterium SURF_17]